MSSLHFKSTFQRSAEPKQQILRFTHTVLHTHRGVYPRWPDEGRDEQRGQVEQETQRAFHVSSHDEEHCGDQPVVAWINIQLRDWKEQLKSQRIGGNE